MTTRILPSGLKLILKSSTSSNVDPSNGAPVAATYGNGKTKALPKDKADTSLNANISADNKNVAEPEPSSSGSKKAPRKRNRNKKKDSNAQSLPSTSQPTELVEADNGKLDLRSSLIQQLERETYECMVCYERVRARDLIWNCAVCFSVLHFKCCTTWANKSASELDGWRCPGCQNVTLDAPTDPSCFCRKEIRPQRNRYTPHSCRLI
jgi:hypothetical protein